MSEPLIVPSLADAAAFGPCAVTIGNFDGVHLGHQALLKATVEAARARNLRPAVLMFSPHPACIVAPERAPRLLTTTEERCRLMAEQGIEAILVQPFTAQLAKLSPAEFATQFLRDGLHAGIVLVGENFRFGNKHAGDTTTLSQLGSQLGFDTQFLSPVRWRGIIASASEIRSRILGGEVRIAGRLLGRPSQVSGYIISGHGIGSKQTVPTLNLRTEAEVIPSPGVYITHTRDQHTSREWNSITNVGFRPTFGDVDELSIETFLLSPFDGRTPSHIQLAFLRRVRDEHKFESPEALRTQIFKDVHRANAYFRRSEARLKHLPQTSVKTI